MFVVDYDPQADAMYIQIAEGVIAHTREMPDGVLVDLDAEGVMLGVEVMSPDSPWEWPVL